MRLRFRFGRSAVVAAAVIAATTLAGCGGDSSDSGSGSGAGGGGGVTNIKVGYVPYADDAAAFLAQEKGIFRKHGLNAEFVPAANPTAIVAAMLSGQYQFGFITDPVLINVNVKGTPIKCVAPVIGRQPADTKRDGTTLIAGKGTGIKSVKDLAGKKVAMVQLNSLNSLDVQTLASQEGIDHKSIQLIQMPFPQMPAALSQGRVQAAVIVQPFAQTAIEQGATVLNHPNAVLWAGGTTVCFSALGKYIDDNPDVVKNFNAAMREAILYTKDHESEAKATLVKRMNLSPEAAQKQVLQTDWNPTLTPETIDKIQTHMKQFGLLEKTMPGSQMVWEGAL
ncbi:MAG TPA: ABC transporter substrate-binding protein [Streptosporangiaceae bacterium]|nr:ABC transporter substrate-binding protein [Streptosporangiaceae bacterium]